MSEATILLAVLNQLTDVIEKVRPLCKQEFHIYPEPITWERVEIVDRNRPASARDCVTGSDDGLIPGYEWWPALEPMYTLRDRVARYQAIAQKDNK